MTQHRKSDPSPLGALLESAHSASIDSGGCPLDVHTWQKAMGKRIAARSTPEHLRDGVLTLRVASSVWSQELSLLSTDIIARLQEIGFSVQRIRCRVGTAPQQTATRRPRRMPTLPDAPLPEELKLRLASVDDAELRQAILLAAQSHLNLLQQKRAELQKRSSEKQPDALAPRSAGARSALQDQNGSAHRGESRHTREPKRG